MLHLQNCPLVDLQEQSLSNVLIHQIFPSFFVIISAQSSYTFEFDNVEGDEVKISFLPQVNIQNVTNLVERVDIGHRYGRLFAHGE